MVRGRQRPSTNQRGPTFGSSSGGMADNSEGNHTQVVQWYAKVDTPDINIGQHAQNNFLTLIFITHSLSFHHFRLFFVGSIFKPFLRLYNKEMKMLHLVSRVFLTVTTRNPHGMFIVRFCCLRESHLMGVDSEGSLTTLCIGVTLRKDV